MDVLLRRAEALQRALQEYLAPNESLRAEVLPGVEAVTESIRMLATVQGLPPRMLDSFTETVDSMERKFWRLKADVEGNIVVVTGADWRPISALP